ncbi:prefoldin subunit 6 [Phellopilus nigrolimitatus]|nr:prefoldin subunit 6 [Phellopilus nigrolimitatus]
MSLEARLQSATADYQKLQLELSAAVDARQRLDAQLTETGMVKKEFALLQPASEVYKLVGPILVKQDQPEAKANVDKRLAFIKSEIQRVEAGIKDINERTEKRRMEIVEIQTAHQAAQQKPGAPVQVQ